MATTGAELREAKWRKVCLGRLPSCFLSRSTLAWGHQVCLTHFHPHLYRAASLTSIINCSPRKYFCLHRAKVHKDWHKDVTHLLKPCDPPHLWHLTPVTCNTCDIEHLWHSAQVTLNLWPVSSTTAIPSPALWSCSECRELAMTRNFQLGENFFCKCMNGIW